MSDRDALLRTILADPADDTARLVYADWLEENGEEERGHYIRFGLDYGYHRGMESDGSTGNEWERAVDVWPPIDWPDSMHTIFRLTPEDRRGVSWVWRRGFVESVSLPLAEFRTQVPNLFAAHPVTDVRLNDREPLGIRGVPSVAWLVDGFGPDRSMLPRELFHELGEGILGNDNSTMLMSFPTRQAAMDALSRACVAWARDLVGLPPLPAQNLHPPPSVPTTG